MTNVLMLLTTITFASINSAALHTIDFSEKGRVFRFNLGCSVIWALVLFILGGRLEFSPNIIIFGGIYAAAQVLFLIFKAKAMSLGSISLTTLIGNMSLVLSTIVGVLIWNESVGISQIIGILMLIISIIICTYEKSELKNTRGWIICCVLFFVFAAAVGVIFKAYSKTGENINNMMLFASILMTIFLAISSAAVRDKTKSHTKVEKAYISKLILCGIISCFYNRINIYLSGAMDSVVFFPSFNGGTIILSAVVGIFAFKEKLKKKQLFGIVMGIASILIIGIMK
ncbi:MAG: GRP family sugar transporter [Clostridia bacterium]|nr:GRP family sugar transporter [Clostridia bacterium]